jgi:hypothetical protein
MTMTGGLDAMADVKASETRDAAYANKEKALAFLAAPEAIAARALRGLGFACARNPRLMLSEKFRKALDIVLLAPICGKCARRSCSFSEICS